MPVLTLAKVTVRPEDREAFIARFNAYKAQIQAEEPGTLAFNLFSDVDDANGFAIEEVFADEAARQTHLDSPYHDAAVQDLRQFMTGGSAAKYVSDD